MAKASGPKKGKGGSKGGGSSGGGSEGASGR